MEDYSVVANGTYKARAIDGVLCKTSTGKEQVAIRFQLLAEGYGGIEVTWFGFFTPKTERRTLDALDYMGWDGEDISELAGIGQNEVEIVIENEVYQDKKNSKVRWVNRVGGGGLGGFEALPPNEAQSFAQRLRGATLAAKREREATGDVAAAPAPEPAKSVQPFGSRKGDQGDWLETSEDSPPF